MEQVLGVTKTSSSALQWHVLVLPHMISMVLSPSLAQQHHTPVNPLGWNSPSSPLGKSVPWPA